MLFRSQDRGLTIDAIRDLCKQLDSGELDLAEWLGVERELKAPWAHDGPRALSEIELGEWIHSNRPGLLAELLRLRLIERRDELYIVPSPALLGAAMKLEAAGVPLDVTTEVGRLLGKHMERTAADLAGLFVKRLDEGRIDGALSPHLLTVLRPAAMETVRVLFGQQMERQLRRLFETGRIAKVSAKLGRRKGKRP